MQQVSSSFPVFSAPEVVVDHATEAQIAAFLREHASDFAPPLDVCMDVSAYARKLRRYARTFEIWDDQRLDALMAAYFNEDLGQIFISHLCAARARSGKGLGSLLINQLKRYGIPYRVIRLEVRKDNLRARAFYARHGFSPERETEERLTLMCPLNICQPGISPPGISPQSTCLPEISAPSLCPQRISSSSSSAAHQP